MLTLLLGQTVRPDRWGRPMCLSALHPYPSRPDCPARPHCPTRPARLQS
jgi:hypothetical protein